MKLAEMANHLDEVQDWTWDIEPYIKFVLSPLEKAIKEIPNDDSHRDVLLALLSSGSDKLQEMTDSIQRDIGNLKIKTRSGDCGCFLGEKIIRAYVELTDTQSSVSAQGTNQKHLFLERRHAKREG